MPKRSVKSKGGNDYKTFVGSHLAQQTARYSVARFSNPQNAMQLGVVSALVKFSWNDIASGVS